MITQTTDPTFFNRVANMPEVYQWIMPPDKQGIPIDVAPLLDRGATALCSDHGGFILVPSPDGTWEPHGFFEPQHNRAERALDDTYEAIRWTFKHIGTFALTLDVPRSSSARGTGKLLTASGFEAFAPYGTEKVRYELTRTRFLSLQRGGFYATIPF